MATSICLTWGTLQAIGGRKPEWEPMLRQLQGPMFGRLLLLGCIQYFVIAVSAIVLIGPLFLIPLWAVTIPVMMVERTDIGGAFNRSMDLTAGRRLPILGVFLLWFVIFALGAIVIILVLGHGALGSLALWIYGALAGIVVHTLPAIFYVLLREEKEGVTAGQITAGRTRYLSGKLVRCRRARPRTRFATAYLARLAGRSRQTRRPTVRAVSTSAGRRTDSSLYW